jgi:hypothetical protein
MSEKNEKQTSELSMEELEKRVGRRSKRRDPRRRHRTGQQTEPVGPAAAPASAPAHGRLRPEVLNAARVSWRFDPGKSPHLPRT